MRLRLKTAILASGKTQRRVAADIGMPENRLSEIVRGWVTPSSDERERLVSALGQPVDDSLFAIEQQPCAAQVA